MKLSRWIFRFFVAFGLAIALGSIPYKIYGPEGVTHILRLENDLDRLAQENQTLEKRNEDLLRKIKTLKHDRKEIEKVARDELGLVRSEDIVFILQ